MAVHPRCARAILQPHWRTSIPYTVYVLGVRVNCDLPVYIPLVLSMMSGFLEASLETNAYSSYLKISALHIQV